MEKLRESYVFKQGEFQKSCSKLNESSFATHHIEKLKLQESCDTESIIKVGLKLKESLAGDDLAMLEKILEALKINGADTSFKVWKIPVAKYDVKNLNGRIYPKALFENVMNNQRDAWCGLCGLADHPVGDNDPGLFRDQAVVWHDMEVGDDGIVYGICSFVGPYGHMAQEILEHGGRVGTSSSGFGDVDKFSKIVDPYTFQIERLADLVLNPSQGTYGSSVNTHVNPKDFTKDMNSAAVIDFTGNHPVHESVENTQPRSKIIMAQANAVNNTNNDVNVVNKLSKVEEKAFRQYVEKFLNEAKNLDNPMKRLNECAEILECFEDGNCADLREKVEAQVLAEKESLMKMVESTSDIQREYGMDAKAFKEAAERNTKQALILNEQVTDYKALVKEMAKNNKALKEEIADLKDRLADQKESSSAKIREARVTTRKSLDKNDRLNENIEELRNKNKVLLEKYSKLNMSTAKLEKSNGLLETKLREAAKIIKDRKSIKKYDNSTIEDLTNKLEKVSENLRDLAAENKSLKEAYNAQCAKFDRLSETYTQYKESVTDMMDPTKHVAPMAKDRIGKYLDLRENGGVEIEAYYEDLKESYGNAIVPFESEIRGAKTLKEATNAFLRHRNDIIAEFNGTASLNECAFRNTADRARIYEEAGMLNPKQSYNDASLESKNAEFLAKQEASGLY